MKTVPNLNVLPGPWEALVRQGNGQEVVIWYTCWPSIRHIIKDVIWVKEDKEIREQYLIHHKAGAPPELPHQ